MRWIRLTSMMLAVSALGGCVSFVPDYRADLYAKLSDVQDQLAKIETTLTTNNALVSYDKLEDYYVAALADLDQARAISSNRATYLRGKIAESPARSADDAIDRCAKAVELDRTKYKDGAPNLAFELNRLKAVKGTCAVSGEVETLFKRKAS